MARPVVALLTDFGTRDHYAGTMKAVVLSVCPDATLVDIGHEIPPHDVAGGRARAGGVLSLLSGRHGLPRRRRSRRGIEATRHRRGHRRLSLRRAGQRRADRRVPRDAAEACRRAAPSASTRGRRSAGPSRGAIASRRPPAGSPKASSSSSLGPRDHRLSDARRSPQPAIDDDAIRGEVVRVDRFGNLITNIDRRTFDRLAQQGAIVVSVERRAKSRASSPPTPKRAPASSARSSAAPIISRSPSTAASAADLLGLSRGAPVTVVARHRLPSAPLVSVAVAPPRRFRRDRAWYHLRLP